MNRTVKVGDKVKITNTFGAYKVGDILPVIAISTLKNGDCWVRTNKDANHGQCGADRKVEPPFAYLASSEYELVAPPQFKPGDIVCLSKHCYKMPEWAALDRKERKWFSTWAGQNLDYRQACQREPDRIHAGGVCIPAALVELVVPLVQIEAERAVADAVERFKSETNIKPRNIAVGDLFVVTGEHWCCNAGQVVRYTGKDSSCGQLGYFVWENMPKYEQIALWWKWLHPSPAAPLPPTPHRYTPEQITEARDVVYRLMTGLSCIETVQAVPVRANFLDHDDKRNRDKPHTVARLYSTDGCLDIDEMKEQRRAVAFCSPDDEWNDDIGRLVALCKLLHEPMPAWIGGVK